MVVEMRENGVVDMERYLMGSLSIPLFSSFLSEGRKED